MPVPYDGKRIIRPGTQHDWTPEMKKELLASKKDLMHFALNHVKVQTVDKGVTTLDFRPYQERMFKAMTDENRLIVLSPRQTGKCEIFDTKIRLRHKITGEIIEMKVGDFFENLKKSDEDAE
jgi:hypothetical protein